MRFRLTILSVLLLTFHGIRASTGNFAEGKQVPEARVKAALIVNFAQNIQWSGEGKISTFQIGIIDQDSSVYNELNAVRYSQKIKGKPFSVSLIGLTDTYSQFNILYFGEQAGKALSNIYRDINHKGILVITDRSTDRVLTMVNIVFNKDKKTFSFEVNKENLDANGFTVNPKILLLGGSYVDIKELYLQTTEQLHAETDRILQYKTELDRISREKNEYQNEVSTLNRKVEALALSIKQSEQEYASLTENLKIRDSLLAIRTVELYKKVEESRLLQNLIKSQLSAINNATLKLDSLDFEIDSKQKELNARQTRIDQQTEKLTRQDSIILFQQKRFVVAILVSLGLCLSLIFAFWAYKIKQGLNIKLERLVNERTRELEISREYFENLFENSPIAMFELDLSVLKNYIDKIDYAHKLPFFKGAEVDKTVHDGLNLIKVINTNQAGVDLFGFRDKEDARLNYINTYSQTFASDSFKTVFYAMLERQPSCAYEGVRQTVNGDILYVHLKWMVLPGYEEGFEKVLLTISDITKLKSYQKELSRHKEHLEDIVYERTAEIVKLNEELTSANAELQKKTEELSQIIQVLRDTQAQLVQSEKMASLGMLTAGIAHEINNPVNFISGSYQALHMQLDEMWNLLGELRRATPISSDIEAKLHTNADELYQSMKFLLSNIEVGTTRTTEIIKSLMAFSRNECQEHAGYSIQKGVKDVLVILKSKYIDRIEIVEDYDDKLPELVCNSNGINQVLMNLISNAIDAIPQKGQIGIAAKYNSNSDEILIRISDSGVGIPDSNLDKIFDPFFTTKEVGGGTGLGLYISYNMVKAHHGVIEVDSTVGGGTVFTVRIPRCGQNNAPQA